MDPITALGAAGSVVGIADVAFQLVKSISKAYAEIASTEVVLRTIIDEVESMGTALSQISNLVSAEERNVKQGLGFKLFTRTALSDVRKTAEKCLVVFWRIEGTILDKAGTSDFEKNIETRRAEFRKQARGKGKGTSREFQLTEDLADVATSFFRRTKWQLKGTIPKLREYCDQLRGYQLVFTVMLATINLQTSQQRHDWGAIVIALSQISTVNQQKSIPAVLADLSSGDQEERVLSPQKSKNEGTRTPSVDQSSRKEQPRVLATNQLLSKDKELYQVGDESQGTPPQPHPDMPEKPFSAVATISQQSIAHQTTFLALASVPERLTTTVTENGEAVKSPPTPAHTQQEQVEDNINEVGLASLSNMGKPPGALFRSLSDGKPATEDQSERIITKSKVEGYKPSITSDSGTKMPGNYLSTNEAEDSDGENNDGEEDLDRGHDLVNTDVMGTHMNYMKIPGASIPSSNHDLSPRVATLSELHRPTETVSIRDVSPSARFHYLARTIEPPKLVVEPENILSVTSDSSNDEPSNDPDGSEDRSRLAFIVKDGLAQPAPRLSNRGLDRSLTGRFSLRSPRDFGYRDLAFLDDQDRKAIDSLLEHANPSKQASVQMKMLKKSSPLGFGKAKPAILVIIEEPGKSPKGGGSVTNRSSGGASTAKTNSKSSHGKEISDEDYIQWLTSYKVISIQPLLDVQRPKTSITKTEWDNCVKTELNLDHTEIVRRLGQIDKDGFSVASKRRSLNSQQRLQIQTVFVEAARANTDLQNYEYTIRQLELIKKRVRLWSLKPVTLAIVVYLQRSPRPHVDPDSLFSARHSRGPSHPPSNSLRYPNQDPSLFAPPPLLMPRPPRHVMVPPPPVGNRPPVFHAPPPPPPPPMSPMYGQMPPMYPYQPMMSGAGPPRPPPPLSDSNVVDEKFRVVHKFSPARSQNTIKRGSGPDVVTVELERAKTSGLCSSSSSKSFKNTSLPLLSLAPRATTRRAHPRPSPGPPPPPPMLVPQQQTSQQTAKTKTTYTRMARRHLSLECLNLRGIEYGIDANPEYVIIKRWVPPEEQKELWALTKVIREGRKKVTTTLAIEDRSYRHHHRDSSDDSDDGMLMMKRKPKWSRNRRPSKGVPKDKMEEDERLAREKAEAEAAAKAAAAREEEIEDDWEAAAASDEEPKDSWYADSDMASAVDASDRVVIGGLIGNRMIPSSKQYFIEDESTGQSRSRSRARSESSKGGGGGGVGRAALATAGLGAIGAKKPVDNVRNERLRSRRRDGSRDSYDNRFESLRGRPTSRRRAAVDWTSDQLPPTVSVGMATPPEERLQYQHSSVEFPAYIPGAEPFDFNTLPQEIHLDTVDGMDYSGTRKPQGTFAEVDKDIVNMLLRRWTPGTVEVSDGSEGRASEDEEDVASEVVEV